MNSCKLVTSLSIIPEKCMLQSCWKTKLAFFGLNKNKLHLKNTDLGDEKLFFLVKCFVRCDHGLPSLNSGILSLNLNFI